MVIVNHWLTYEKRVGTSNTNLEIFPIEMSPEVESITIGKSKNKKCVEA